MRWLRARADSDTLPGIPTGFYDLDVLLGGGAYDGNLLIVSNRPGGGKTSFALQISTHAASLGKHVFVASIEMDVEEVVMRWQGPASAVDGQKIKTGRMDVAEWDSLQRSDRVPSRADDPHRRDFIDDRRIPSVSLSGFVRTGLLDMVVVDSLNLLRTRERFSKTSDMMNYIAEELKSIAKDFNVPVWAAHQMSRAVEGRSDNEPVLLDLREAGEQPANVVIFIVHSDDGTSFLKVAKARSGPVGKVDIRFDPATTRFQNVARM